MQCTRQEFSNLLIEKMTIKEIIQSADPLSKEACEILLQHKEEDIYVDYKVDFSDDQVEWLNITIDMMAFANTLGGYLVFGIENSKFELVGVQTETVHALDNANLQNKINRYLYPPLTNIRVKVYNKDEKAFVIIFIPETRGKTHIITKDGNVETTKGNSRTLLRKGIIYIRRSGGNQIIDPEALDFIIDKRIDDYKNKFLDRIARVVQEPINNELYFIETKEKDVQSGKTFSVTDSQDAIEIKGTSFRIPPKSDEELVAAWAAISTKESSFVPPITDLWSIYLKRESLNLHNSLIIKLIEYCLCAGLPVFYWLQRLKTNEIKDALSTALEKCKDILQKENIIKIGAFLGKSFHAKLIK